MGDQSEFGHVAFVAGATGHTGRAVVQLLCERGIQTYAHIRPNSRSRTRDTQYFESLGASVVCCAWEPAALLDVLTATQPQSVYCLIGTTRKTAKMERLAGDIYETVDYGLSSMLLQASVACGAKPKFIYLSSMGVGTDEPRSAYLRARYRVEAELRDSGLSYVSARPSFITGNRIESRPIESFGAVVGDGLLSVMGAFGAKRMANNYRSQTGAQLAESLIRLGMDDTYDAHCVDSAELQRIRLR